MNPVIVGELARDHLITRERAVALGLRESAVDVLVRHGEWVSAWRGVYTTGERWAALDEHVGQPRLRARAAGVRVREPHVLSHDSAALELGLDVLHARDQPVHLTRRGQTLSGRNRGGLVCHRAPFRDDEVLRLPDGRECLGPARTVADIARSRGVEAGLVAADSALRLGVTRDELRAALVPMRSWPGITSARQVVELADGGADSPGETLSRLVLVELGHRPEVQVGLSCGERRMWCDLRVERLVVEFDGRVKYGNAESLWEEKRRQDDVHRLHLGVARVVWVDLFGSRRAELKSRLEGDLARVRALWGSDVVDMQAHRLTCPRPRPTVERPFWCRPAATSAPLQQRRG